MMTRGHLQSQESKVLKYLQADNQTTNSAIGKAINSSQGQVSKISSRLRQEGYIIGDKSIVDPEKIGFVTLAYIYVKFNDSSRKANKITTDYIAEFPNVQEIHHISGEFDLMIKLRGRNNAAVMRFIDYVNAQGNSARTESTMVLETLRETLELDWGDEPD